MSDTTVNDSLDFVFWHIRPEDSDYPFRTANLAFDEISQSQTLQEYYLQDISMQGAYTTFVFGQKFTSPSSIYGFLRYREVPEQDLLEEIRKIATNSIFIEKLDQIFAQDNPQIIYLSRIGIAFDMQRKGIGFLLKDFFEFLIKREQRNTIIYVKVIAQSEKMLGNQYQKIGEGFSDTWGEYSLYIRYLILS